MFLVIYIFPRNIASWFYKSLLPNKSVILINRFEPIEWCHFFLNFISAHSEFVFY